MFSEWMDSPCANYGRFYFPAMAITVSPTQCALLQWELAVAPSKGGVSPGPFNGAGPVSALTSGLWWT